MAEVFGLHTFVDLLHFFPFRYVDKTQWVTIAQLQPHLAEIQIKGTLVQLEEVPQKRGARLVGYFSDETGSMELVWFKGTKWLRQNLKIGQQYSVFGKIQRFGSTYSMPHPDMEVYPAEKTLTITYPTVDIATTPRYIHRVDEVQLSSAGGSVTLMDTAVLEPDGIVAVNFTMTTLPTITGGSPNQIFVFHVDLHYQSTKTTTKNKTPNFWT